MKIVIVESPYAGDIERTADIKTAPATIEGNVKWDGCANWHAADNGCAFHACGPDDFDKLAQALKDAHQGAAEFMPWAPIAEEYRDA